MEQRLKFLAAIISGVVTSLATILLFQQFTVLALILLVLPLVLRFNAISLTASVLVGLAFEAVNRRQTSEFAVIVLLLILGVAVEVAVIVSPLFLRIFRERGLSSPTWGETTIFAVVGISMSIFILYQAGSCGSGNVGNSGSIQFDAALKQFGQCANSFTQETDRLAKMMDKDVRINPNSYWPKLLNVIGILAVRFCFVWPAGPFVWAAIFAAIRQCLSGGISITSLSHASPRQSSVLISIHKAYLDYLILGSSATVIPDIYSKYHFVARLCVFPNTSRFMQHRYQCQLSCQCNHLVMCRFLLSIPVV